MISEKYQNENYPKGYPWGLQIEEHGFSKTFEQEGKMIAKEEDEIFTVTIYNEGFVCFRITTPLECRTNFINVYDYNEEISFEEGHYIVSKMTEVPGYLVKKHENIFAGIIDGLYTIVLDRFQSFRIRMHYLKDEFITITNIEGKIVIDGDNRMKEDKEYIVFQK